MNNNVRIDSIDFSKWLKKHEKFICEPYGDESRRILELRDEADKEIRKIINKHGGDDVAEPYCMDLFEELTVHETKKPKFKKKDYNHLRGTGCWESVKALHTMYNESWTSIREERSEVHLDMMELVDLMDELDFDPFSSGENQARKDFLKFMRTPYQNGAQISGDPGDFPRDLISNLDSRCISEDSEIKGFEYYSKLSEFWEWRLDSGMELERIP